MSKVFKFGGSVITDAFAVKKIAKIIENTDDLRFVVLSATYNTTNKLEDAYRKFLNKEDYHKVLHDLLLHHLEISKDLKLDLKNDLREIFNVTHDSKALVGLTSEEILDHFYSIGELASSKILSSYLSAVDKKFSFLDVRNILVTNSVPKAASPLLLETKKRIETLDSEKVYITQGFLGKSVDGITRTLGREGSDYTGAILSWCVDANSLTIWKDVEGIHSCDPSRFRRTSIIKKLSYKSATTLTRLGAKVLFSRTMEPLENKGISLFVRSVFLKNQGTEVCHEGSEFFSVTAKDYDSTDSIVSVVFSPEHKLISKLLENPFKADFFEQGPDFISFKINKHKEEDLIEKILDLQDTVDCK